MDAESPEKHLHTYAREYAARFASHGRLIDKKQLRFNDIVAVGLHYMRCAEPARVEVAEAGVREAIEACLVVRSLTEANPIYIPGGSVRTMIQPWMEAA